MGKRMVILGAAESGVGAAVLAQKKGFDVFVSDMGKIKPHYVDMLDRYGIAWEDGGHTEELVLNADEVIKSPGIPEDAPMVLKVKAAGIPIIVIDPRKNDTAVALNAQWIPIRPATDSALADAMAYVIIKEGLQDQEFLDKCCLGFDAAHMPEGVDPSLNCLSYLMGENDGIPKTPEWGETITGIPADTIRELAIRYATTKPAAIIQGYGAQRNAYGEQSARGVILLTCLTGNVGISGGSAAGSGDCSTHKLPKFPVPDNPYNRELPVFLWTDAIDHGKEMNEYDGIRTCDQGIFDDPKDIALDSNIKMIFNLASNTLVNQHGDINRTAKLLKDTSKCEFIVCSDLFMTASAKFADLLLPGVSMFEEENITKPWKFTEFLGFNNKVIEPLYECKNRI